MSRIEELTREIASHAQRKQLSAALSVYETIKRENLQPSAYTFSALINANVTSGKTEAAQALLAEMVSAGFAPNTVVYTTLLKGHCAAGDLTAARGVLEEMARQKPPVRPDARTLNTYMRGCVRVGDLAAARWAFGMLGSWRLAPQESAVVAHGRLLAQGLVLDDLRGALTKVVEKAAAPVSHRPTSTANPCMFWERGRCDRGLNCHFYHDPSVRQADAQQVEAAARDTELELSVQLAHAAALLGRRNACKHALKRAATIQEQVSGVSYHQGARGGELGEGNRHVHFRREELGRDAALIGEYLKASLRKRMLKRGPPPLGPRLCRLFIFSSRICDDDDGDETATREAVAGALVRALRRTAGLKQAKLLGLAKNRTVRKRMLKQVSGDGRLRWRAIFKHETAADAPPAAAAPPSAADLPIKLELASGTGDWVVAQAQADAGKAAWAALELRHDRVYGIFSRMVLKQVPNLCVIGGDAGRVLRTNLPPSSVSHAFVNFPEPPSGWQGGWQGDEASNIAEHSRA